MNICVFDTETTSLNKPFCYNIGYIIMDTETHNILLKREYVIEQIWHNLELFSTAYYAEKRKFYITEMRVRKITLEKFGYVTQQMKRDFKNFDVEIAFAYNSPFDEKVFEFNCDWFKCINPFDNIAIKDIRAFFINKYGYTDEFKTFCEEHQLFTDSGNYSTSAETAFKFLTNNSEFVEAHTALNDSEIETTILLFCYETDDDLRVEFDSVPKSIQKKVAKTSTIKLDGEELLTIDYSTVWKNKDLSKIYFKS